MGCTALGSPHGGTPSASAGLLATSTGSARTVACCKRCGSVSASPSVKVAMPCARFGTQSTVRQNRQQHSSKSDKDTNSGSSKGRRARLTIKAATLGLPASKPAIGGGIDRTNAAAASYMPHDAKYRSISEHMLLRVRVSDAFICTGDFARLPSLRSATPRLMPAAPI
eukprot:COSAG01_NODE_1674_length_9542_cov_35.944827_8_plen_168_part_00